MQLLVCDVVFDDAIKKDLEDVKPKDIDNIGDYYFVAGVLIHE